MKEAGYLRKTAALIAKDFRIEARGRDTLPPMLAFSLAVGLLLAFTLPATTRMTAPLQTPLGTVALADVVSGFLWVTVLFAGLIGFARTFEVERSDGALEALLLAPIDRSAVFVSKATANLGFLLGVQLFVCPVFALFFSFRLGLDWLTFVLVVTMVDVAFVASGTLFASLAAQTRSRELILPILALPALVPVFIGGTELTTDLLLGGGLDQVAARGWFVLLAAFDVVFLTVGLIAFDYVLE